MCTEPHHIIVERESENNPTSIYAGKPLLPLVVILCFIWDGLKVEGGLESECVKSPQGDPLQPRRPLEKNFPHAFIFICICNRRKLLSTVFTFSVHIPQWWNARVPCQRSWLRNPSKCQLGYGCAFLFLWKCHVFSKGR